MEQIAVPSKKKSTEALPSVIVKALLGSASKNLGQSTLHRYLNDFQFAPLSELSSDQMNVNTVNLFLKGLSGFAKDEHLPIKLGFTLSIKELGSFGQAIITSPTWKRWFDIIGTYSGDIGLHKSYLEMRESESSLSISILRENEKSLPFIHFFSGIFIKLLMVSCKANDEPNIETNSDLISVLSELSGLKLASTGQAICNIKLVFNSKKLKASPRYANPRVHKVFISDLSDSSAPQSNNETVLKVISLIDSQPTLQGINQQWAAEKLFMSERNLLRKLNASGISFRDLFGKVRRKRALALLFTRNPVGDIAERLGYSERATFERAFKSWQGITPVAMQSRFALLSEEKRLGVVISPEQIPVPPKTLMNLIGLLKDNDVEMEALALEVESDPVLTTKVLNIANSALYGYKKISSVKQAILTVLGTRKLQAIVISLLSSDAFGAFPDWFPYARFRFRSVASAQLAEQLLQYTDADEYEKLLVYLCALLHNIGEMALQHCLEKSFKKLVQDGMYELTWQEQINLQTHRLGIHTMQISELLLSTWDFPSDITALLRKAGLCKDFIQREQIPFDNVLAVTLELVSILDSGGERAEKDCQTLLRLFFNKQRCRPKDIDSILKKINTSFEVLKENADSFDVL